MERSWILSMIILFLLCGCQSSSPDALTGPQLAITQAAGTMPDMEWNFLPYPAHYGKIGNYHILLLSKAPNIGDSRSIKPIGMITTVENGEDQQWIIANDPHADYMIDGLEDVNDLMTTHNGIKSTLERWIINHGGIGQIQLKGWTNAPSLPESNNQ